MPRSAARVAAPNLNITPTLGATSPPQTPTSSPNLNRKFSAVPPPLHTEPPPHPAPTAQMPPLPAQQRKGNRGRNPARPPQPCQEISPISSPQESTDHCLSGSSDAESDESGPSRTRDVSTSPFLRPSFRQPRYVFASAEMVGMEIEELSDFDPMDSDAEYSNVLRPHGFESPESGRSRSVSRHRELDPEIMEDMQNLTCSNDNDSEEIDPEDLSHREFIRHQAERRRRTRISNGSSIGKRAASERSDSDREDLRSASQEALKGDRRTRRRVGDRWSLGGQFQDSMFPKIPESDEPDSSDDVDYGESLAKELPYYDVELMDVESDEDEDEDGDDDEIVNNIRHSGTAGNKDPDEMDSDSDPDL